MFTFRSLPASEPSKNSKAFPIAFKCFSASAIAFSTAVDSWAVIVAIPEKSFMYASSNQTSGVWFNPDISTLNDADILSKLSPSYDVWNTTPTFAFCIFLPISESVGTAYVIVFGLNVTYDLFSKPLTCKSPCVNIKSPCNTPLIFNFDKCCSATFNLSRKPLLSLSPASAWFVSMSCDDLFNFGSLLNTPFVPTKNFPSAGSIPQNIAGDPSHFVVMLNFLGECPFTIVDKFFKKRMASTAPFLPLNKDKSSKCVRCVLTSSVILRSVSFIDAVHFSYAAFKFCRIRTFDAVD